MTRGKEDLYRFLDAIAGNNDPPSEEALRDQEANILQVWLLQKFQMFFQTNDFFGSLLVGHICVPYLIKAYS